MIDILTIKCQKLQYACASIEDIYLSIQNFGNRIFLMFQALELILRLMELYSKFKEECYPITLCDIIVDN